VKCPDRPTGSDSFRFQASLRRPALAAPKAGERKATTSLPAQASGYSVFASCILREGNRRTLLSLTRATLECKCRSPALNARATGKIAWPMDTSVAAAKLLLCARSSLMLQGEHEHRSRPGPVYCLFRRDADVLAARRACCGVRCFGAAWHPPMAAR